MIVGLDPGSSRAALCALSATPSVLAAETFPVDADDVTGAALAIVGRIAEAPPDVVAIEFGPWYPPRQRPGQSPGAYAAQLMATQRAWSVCDRLVRAVEAGCAAIVPPVPTVQIGRQTWAHRVAPHTSGGIGDALIAERLPVLLGDSFARLADVHQRDAAGVALGWLLRDVPKAKRKRVRSGKRMSDEDVAELKAAREARRSLAAQRRAWGTRVARGCTCEHEGPCAPPCPLLLLRYAGLGHVDWKPTPPVPRPRKQAAPCIGCAAGYRGQHEAECPRSPWQRAG